MSDKKRGELTVLYHGECAGIRTTCPRCGEESLDQQIEGTLLPQLVVNTIDRLCALRARINVPYNKYFGRPDHEVAGRQPE